LSKIQEGYKKARERIGNIKEIYKNIILIVLICIVLLFVGITILFSISLILPGDPVAAYLAAQGIHNPSQGQYHQMECQLGFCDPIYIQYFRFIGNLLTGDWGISVSILQGQPISSLLEGTIQRMIEMSLLPMIIGIGLGFFLGKFAAKNRGRLVDKLIQLFYFFGLSIPIFFLGMVLKFSLGYELGWFETAGYLSAEYEDPPVVTGFLIIDAMISGEFHLIGDYLWHLFLPGICLFISTIAIITWQTRSYMINGSYEKSPILHTFLISRIFGLIFSFYILIDYIFNLYGLSRFLIDSIFLYDYFVITAVIFIILLIFIVIIFISNIVFSVYRYLRNKGFFIRKTDVEIKFDNELESSEVSSDQSLKVYFWNTLKSPLGIIGIASIFFFILISFIPQILTSYTLDEALATHPGAWSSPSPDHPLGQTVNGGDVLALITYGIQEAMFFGIIVVVLGLTGGLIFGYIGGRFGNIAYYLILALMTFVYIFPILVLVLMIAGIYGPYSEMIVPIIEIFLVPNFTYAIANTIRQKLSRDRIIKTILIQIPLNFAIAILIYTSVGYLGFIIDVRQQLGTIINQGMENPYLAPWAVLYPGLAIFGIVFSFLVLHLALKDFNLVSGNLPTVDS